MNNREIEALREKVRAQAKRLTYLENYKALCEKRITELSPSHPLPLTAEVLGTDFPERAQLHHALQRAQRLEHERKSDSADQDSESVLILLREKSVLEDTYRKEVERSEEQRALIETLKQALEARVERTAGGGEATAIAAVARAQEQADALRKESVRLQSELKNQAAINDEVIELARSKDTKLKSTESELRKAQARLDSVQRDKASLESANSLLESTSADLRSRLTDLESTLQTHTATIATLTADLRRVTTAHNTALKLQEDTAEKLLGTQQLVDQLTAQRDLLLAESTSQQLKSTQHQASVETAQSMIKDQLATIRSLTEQLSEIKARGEHLQRTVETTSSDRGSLQLALDQCKSALESALAEKTFFQQALNAAKQELGEKEAAEYRAKGEITELKKALKVLLEGSEAAARSAQAQDNELMAKIRTLEVEKAGLEATLGKERTAFQQSIAELKEKAAKSESDSSEAILRLEKAAEASKVEASDHRKALEAEIKRQSIGISALEKELYDSRRQHDQVLVESKETQSKLRLSEESRAVTLKELEDVRSQLSSAKVTIARCQETTRMLEAELNAISTDFERNRSEVEQENEGLRSENRQLKLQFDDLQGDIEGLKDDLLGMKQQLEDARAREISADEKVTSLSELIYAANSALETHLQRLRRALHIAASGEGQEDILRTVADFSAVIDSIQSRLDAENRAIETLQSELKESNSARDKALKELKLAEVYKAQIAVKEANFTAELRSLSEQLSSERLSATQKIEKTKSQTLSLDSKLQTYREESARLRERLQGALEENEDLMRENAQVQVLLQNLQEKVEKKEGEMRRWDRVVNLTTCALQPGSDVRRVLIEAVEVSSSLSRVEASRGESEQRLAELETYSGNYDSEKRVITERTTLLRLDTERAALEQRLLDLERELSRLSADSTSHAAPKATVPRTPVGDNTEFTATSRVNRYDPRISPLLTNSIEARLSETRGTERLMQTTLLARTGKSN